MKPPAVLYAVFCLVVAGIFVFTRVEGLALFSGTGLQTGGSTGGGGYGGVYLGSHK